MKIICIGKNYADHAKEMNSKVPKTPLVFMKPETALNPKAELLYPDFTNNLHFELELVLKITKIAKSVSEEAALDYFEEVGLGIDFTARDIQADCKQKGFPWEKAKSFDNSASLGGFMHRDKLNLEDIKFSLEHNSKLAQVGNSKDMIFNFSHIISYCSNFFTLMPGDLIFTGTPAGVAAVEKGDILEGYLNGDSLLKVSII